MKTALPVIPKLASMLHNWEILCLKGSHSLIFYQQIRPIFLKEKKTFNLKS